MKIRPVGKKILIKKKEADQYYPGTNIMIPKTSQKDSYKGFVVAIGKEVEEISVGDLVQYADYITPTEMQHENETHYLINAGDILAVYE